MGGGVEPTALIGLIMLPTQSGAKSAPRWLTPWNRRGPGELWGSLKHEDTYLILPAFSLKQKEDIQWWTEECVRYKHSRGSLLRGMSCG